MRFGSRCVLALALALGAATSSGCTISDGGDKTLPAKTSAESSQTAATASSPVDSSGAAMGSSTTGSAAFPSAAAGAPNAAPTSATGTTPSTASGSVPAGGALSPDSVDVGRRAKGDTLPPSRMRLEVDLAARKLYVYDGDQRIATQSVAVGSPQWPTQTGQWTVKQVIWNPEWIPPDETWAEQRTPKKPGAPDNPLGRAQLVYDPPRTIHGTNEPSSIGKNVSHGSIRLPNAVIVALGKQLMEASGAHRDDAWYRRVQQNRTEKVVVDLPQRVPIRVF